MRRARVLVAALAVVVACGRGGSPRKEPVARLPLTALPYSGILTPDLAHFAYLVHEGDGTRMVRDGAVVSEPFRAGTNRTFSANALHHVYWMRQFDNRPLLMVDDRPFQIGFARQEYVVFDDSGEHWAVLASAPDSPGAIVIRDGTVLGPFADASIPAWSRTTPPALAYLRMKDESVLARHAELVVGDAVVRQNDGNAAVCAPMITEELEGPALPREATVRYLSDGRLLALMPHGDKWALWRGEEQLGLFDATAPASATSAGPYMLTGPDSCADGHVIIGPSVNTAAEAPVVAWWERAAGDRTWRVLVDGRPTLAPGCLRPWSQQPPQLAANGRGIAFPCSVRFDAAGEAVKIVHGLKQYGPYPEVWALALSDDGDRIAYGASDGTLDIAWAVYADGQQLSERYYAVWRPRFDPSGRHLAWEASRSANGPNVLVIDGRTVGTFDHLIDGPLFDRPGEVGWLIRRKNRLARLNFPLGP